MASSPGRRAHAVARALLFVALAAAVRLLTGCDGLFALPDPGSGTLAFDPAQMDLDATGEGAGPVQATVHLSNRGARTISWHTSSDKAWLTVTPATGMIGSGATMAVRIEADPTGLPGGSYSATVKATDASGGSAPAVLDVVLSTSGGSTVQDGIFGTVYYTGAASGEHPLVVYVAANLEGEPVAVRFFTVTDSELADGYAFSVTNIPEGTYVLGIWWDVIGDGDPEGDPIYANMNVQVAAGKATDLGNCTLKDPSDGTLLVTASVSHVPSFGAMAFVQVSDDGTPVNDATVTVNDVTLENTGATGEYQPSDALTIGPDEQVTLSVTSGDRTAGATLVMPDAPVVTQPTAGTYSASQDLTVAWNALSILPDMIQLVVDSTYTASGEPYFFMEAGRAESHIIPGGTLKGGASDIIVLVIAANIATSLGADADPSSSFAVSSYATSEQFSTQAYPPQ